MNIESIVPQCNILKANYENCVGTFIKSKVKSYNMETLEVCKDSFEVNLIGDFLIHLISK